GDLLPELADPLPAGHGAVRARRAPGGRGCFGSGGGVLGRDRPAPRPAEVRVLFQGAGRAPAPGRRGDGPARPVVGGAVAVRARGGRRAAGRDAAAGVPRGGPAV